MMPLKSLPYYVVRPISFVRRAMLKVHEWRNPNEPWMAGGAIAYCAGYLRPHMKVIEWGSGRSTAWFAEKCSKMVSIEHHEGWYAHVSAKLKNREIRNVDYRLVELEHDINEPTRPVYSKTPRYVSVVTEFEPEFFDLAIVDGHYRQACILAVLSRIKPGGLLLLDNSNWLDRELWGVPSSWELVHESSNVVTQTTIWKKPDETAAHSV